MALVSMADYAKAHGATKQAASKWKAKGCLKIVDGKIDAEASDRLMAHAGLGRFAERSTTKTSTGAKARQPMAGLAAQLTAAAEEDEGDLAPVLIAFAENLALGHTVDLIKAQTIKENGLALIRMIEARKRAGEVVEMADAEAVIFEMFRLQRDAWLNFPSRVAPVMAADLGIEADRVLEVLTAHVHQQLADLGQPSNPLRETGSVADDSAQGPKPAAAPESAGMG